MGLSLFISEPSNALQVMKLLYGQRLGNRNRNAFLRMGSIPEATLRHMEAGGTVAQERQSMGKYSQGGIAC